MKTIRPIIFLIFLIPVNTLFSGAVDNELINADSIITVLNDEAYAFYRAGRFEDSRDKLQQILELREKYTPEKVLQITSTYVNLIVVNRNMWDFETALDYCYKALDLTKQFDSTSNYIGRLFSSITEIYLAINDYEKATQYLNATNAFFEKYQYGKDISLKLFDALICMRIKSYDNAIKILLELEELTKDKYKILNDIALNYISTGKIDEAGLYYRKIFALPDLEENLLYQVYMNYGIFLYEQKNNRDSALYYYRLALDNAEEFRSHDSNLIALINQNFGELYLNENEITLSLEYFQKALKAVSRDFTESDFLKNPVPGKAENLNRYYRIFKLKTRALYEYYMQTGDTRFLRSSLEVSHLCFDIINRIRYRITSEGSQFSIAEDEKDVYSFAITTAYNLYELTGEEIYLDQAFRINEMGRAFVLLAHLRNQRAMEYGKIPSRIVVQEKELNRKLSFYEEQIMAERQNKQPDASKINMWEEFLVNFNLEYEKLLRELEKDYPEYYDLKYRTDYITPPEVRRRLGKNDAVIEYSLVDSLLYTFIITREFSRFYRHNVGNKLIQECNDFYRLITTQNFSKEVHETYVSFCTQGYRLYSLLLEPFEEDIKDRNLIIVADGEISYLPFDALLTEEFDASEFNYRALPYLIHKNSVGFSYSSTMHFHHGLKRKVSNRKVLAFAPTYSNLMTNFDGSGRVIQQEERFRLIMLPGVRDEVRKIARHVNTDIFLDYKALESNFKKHASDYEILHLAMHTIMDDDNPLYSRMAFTQLTDTIDDGFLHAYEIYNMQFNAKLAVLSSCSSGFGKLQEGEGMQSLARSFAYAGCPGILMSLWEVADYATVKLMENFYIYLEQGLSKPEALRLSKLDFLSEADHLRSNPFFWSSFITLGDSSPVYNSFKLSVILWGLPLIILAGFGLLYYRKKMIKKNFGWVYM